MNTYSCKTLLFLLAFGGALAPAMATVPAHTAAIAPSGSRHQTIPTALRPAFYQALAKDASAAYAIAKNGCASLPKQQLTACFDRHGAHFTGAASPLALRLVAWGRRSAGDANGGKFVAAKPVTPAIRGNEVRYAHGNLSAWWRVLPIGFEQGFTIARRPAGSGALTLALTTSRPDAGAPTICRPGESRDPVEHDIPTFGRDTTSHGIPAAGMTNDLASARTEQANDNAIAWGKLRYGRLVVTDAKGKIVPATLKRNSRRILIAVNDARATYPLTVDPLVWIEQKVAAGDGAANDLFGISVAASGATALVGAQGADSYQGAVYVFQKSNGNWTETHKLTASDGAAGDDFGRAVALDGNTAVVGAYGANVNGVHDQGAAYVFDQSGGVWTQVAKLTASDGAADDEFGWSVALSGSTAFVGSPNATVDGDIYRGAAYVFENAGGTWSQTQKLLADNGAQYDGFGTTVAIDGTTALVAAACQNADENLGCIVGGTYVFTQSGGSWTQLTELDGGAGSAAISGTVVVTTQWPGCAQMYYDFNGTWLHQGSFCPDGLGVNYFGWSVAISGATMLIGAPGWEVARGRGKVYVYDNADGHGQWTLDRILTATDGVTDDRFGISVAFAGRSFVIGATRSAGTTLGAAYFTDGSDLGLTISAPHTVNRGEDYVSQTIATNNATAISPAVTATITVPAAASFVSATASQGTCDEAGGVVTCSFGPINANAGTASANVTLKATGAVGDVIANTARVAFAQPNLRADAATTITEAGGCPGGYGETDGTLNAHQLLQILTYQAAAGQENAILAAPAGSQLYLRFVNGSKQKTLRIPGNEIHRQAPAGTYTWAARAGDTGGAYTFCSKHP